MKERNCCQMMMESEKENKKSRIIQQSVFFRISQTCPDIKKNKIVRSEENSKEWDAIEKIPFNYFDLSYLSYYDFSTQR